MLIGRRWTGMALALILVVAGCGSSSIGAMSEGPAAGMWLPNQLPTERMQKLCGFAPDAKWIEHVQRSSVHIGASGSFVSADGLVLTNHHVAAGGLHNISGPGKDYIANGFLAKTYADEILIPGMELSSLVSIEDVSARVKAAVTKDMLPAIAVKARQGRISEIERESLEKTALQSNVVTLYGGALYHLYRYKKYTDVRVVFAPEFAAAFFGGDPDNFEYPRYDLDMTLLRAYENGKPAKVEHYLKFASRGVEEGDAVFVSGHPGHTDRLLPVAVLKGMRDHTLPLRIASMESMERALLDYGAKGSEEARQAEANLFGVQNSLKATRPRLTALQGQMIARKTDAEDAFRKGLRQREDLREYDKAWDRIAVTEQQRAKLYARYMFLEEGRAFATGLFGDARELVRLVAEDGKPDAQRLPEYTQSKRASLEHGLLADTPIYPGLEIAKLTASLRMFSDVQGSGSPEVREILGNKSPAERAAELVHGSKLADAAERKRIRQGGAGAIESSEDPMIQLAKRIDDQSRRIRLEYEASVQEPQTQALTEINQARFALLGHDAYPDATGTLRLAFGLVKGYEQEGHSIAFCTTMSGAFAHEAAHGAKDPYALPVSWHQARGKIDGKTPLNFVCTADITGGNSGSPVVNRAGELVGLIFDSNQQGVADNFYYTDVQARAVSVDSRAIIEALRNIYGAQRLVGEITGETVAKVPSH
jgi:hypothetical protein